MKSLIISGENILEKEYYEKKPYYYYFQKIV